MSNPPRNEPPAPSGRYAYEGLDRVMHEKARLGILTSLISRAEGLPFNALKELCSLTDGNLSRHLSVLSEAGLVEVHKRQEGLRPVSICQLTPLGRRKFLEYLSVLEQIVSDNLGQQPQAEPAHPGREGFSPA